MSAQALSYILDNSSVTRERLKCYYDFSKTGLFVARTGASGNYFAHMPNILPSSNTGNNPATILNHSSATSGSVLGIVTGSTGFLFREGSGDFTRSNVLISGQIPIQYNDCSMVFSCENTGYSAGIIFGSFEKTTDVVAGQTYIGSKGFNFGINDRGHLFFQSLSDQGEYIYCADSLELSNRNVVSLSVGAGEVEICRFDYLNQEFDCQSFPVTTEFVKNSETAYLGTSKTFYKAPNVFTRTFSGYLNSAAIFSGKLSSEALYSIGSGLVGEYYFQQATTYQLTGQITGYNTVYTYETGVTGWTTGITGYKVMNSGYPIFTGGYVATSSSVLEGETGMFDYTLGSGKYIEIKGLLTNNIFVSYEPTGTSAFATLGLQNTPVTKYVYSGVSGYLTGSYLEPMYGPVEKTGIIKQVFSGETPLYETISVTGYESGVYLSGLSDKLKKNYIYFLGERI